MRLFCAVWWLAEADDDGATGSDTVSITVNNRASISEIAFSDDALAQCLEPYPATYVDELTELYCDSRGISDARGIEELTALTRLSLDGNQLTSMVTVIWTCCQPPLMNMAARSPGMRT